MLTKEEVALALPANLKGAATQDLTDQINQAASDPLVAEQIRDNFISWAIVLTEGKFKTTSYLEAVQYASYKMMGYSNGDAYAKTFPARYQQLVANGTSQKDISSYVSAYAKGKLVNLILEKALIPVHVLYQDVYHKAIHVQADLMMNANSEKVRSDAANSILTHLSKPKEAAPTVALQVNVNSEMDALKRMMTDLASQQVTIIDAGYTAKDVAALPLYNKTEENDGPD